MNTAIFLALLITGLLSLGALFWFIYLYLNVQIFGVHKRHLITRIQMFESHAKGVSLPVKVDANASEKISLFTLLGNISIVKALNRTMMKAGLSMDASQLFLITVSISMVIGVIVFVLTNAWLTSAACTIALCLLPYGLIRWLAQRRQNALQKQLPDLLDFMARSLQVGHSLNNTLQMAAADAPEPISSEFKRVFEELNYGSPIQKVLGELTKRIEGAEVRYFVIAAIVNREIGGDLSEILKRVSKLIRERMNMQQTIRVLTSEGRASAVVLGSLPFVIGGLILFIQPNSYELMLNDPLGQKLLVYAGFLMAFGFFWMNRLCNLKR